MLIVLNTLVDLWLHQNIYILYSNWLPCLLYPIPVVQSSLIQKLIMPIYNILNLWSIPPNSLIRPSQADLSLSIRFISSLRSLILNSPSPGFWNLIDIMIQTNMKTCICVIFFEISLTISRLNLSASLNFLHSRTSLGRFAIGPFSSCSFIRRHLAKAVIAFSAFRA